MAVKDVSYNQETYTIAYTIHNPNCQDSIVFLHGWGSNKELMEHSFAACFPHHRLLFVDLPGFGHSTNPTALCTDDYAHILQLFLAEFHLAETSIMIGHSFGGKVASLLAPRNLVLLASSGILLPKPLSVSLKIALAKCLRFLGLGASRLRAQDAQGLSESMYATFKNIVNEDFRPIFAALSSKTLLLWGKDDTATPLCCAHEIAALIPNSKLLVFEGDHYFFLKQAQEVAKNILQYFK